MEIQELMTQTVATCHVNDTLNLAAMLMWEHDCGALPVVNDDGKVTGMITDRDICMAAYTQGKPLDEMLVNIAMSKHVVAVHETQTIGEVEDLMARHQIRRIPVIDPEGRAIGIISLRDLAIGRADLPLAQTLASICRPRDGARHAA